MKRVSLFLGLILLIASFLRFYQLGKNPPSLSWDEASWGYNAYSLGIDGKDEFGRFLPHDYLESFGDFKPPVYAYLDILPIKLFGLNEFGVRFPSALFGTMTVLITYFLTKRIFWQLESKEKLALISAFLLAISPWHINLSRAAFEANVASFFIVLGVWLFLCGIQDKKGCLVLSVVSFVFSFYTFNTARIVSPILILILAVSFRKTLFQMRKQVFLAIIIGLLLLLPSLKFMISPQATLRFKEVNIFFDPDLIRTLNQEVENDKNAWWSKILHNRRFAFSVKYLEHYFANFGPSFLFIRGDGNPKFSTQDVGQLYLWELPFLIMGILFLFKEKKGNWWIVPLWLIIGIAPAATAREVPHALRIETTIPTFQTIVAYGLITLIGKINYRRSLTLSLLGIIIFLNLLYYLHGYYTHYPYDYSQEWQYGYRESINYVKRVEKNYDQVYITTALGRPYIYYLFYTKEDPRFFRQQAKIERDVFGFVAVESFGKYVFSQDPHKLKKQEKRILYISTPSQAPKNIKILRAFNFLNDNPSLIAYSL